MNFESNVNSIKQEQESEGTKKENLNLDQKDTEENNTESPEMANGIVNNCLNQMKTGEDIAVALKNISQEALDKGLEQRELGWQKALNLDAISQTFEHLENAPDEKVEEEYLKYFESQNSDLSLGKILVSLDSVSTRTGFFNVYNNRQSELPQNILKTARIAEKLVDASKRLKKRQENLG
ncbi:MAG: hypothetical protein PHR57_01295 [Patescibacteria group bacterium]|nr:hypothetical protein [Patescibacteria group bacterium]